MQWPRSRASIPWLLWFGSFALVGLLAVPGMATMPLSDRVAGSPTLIIHPAHPPRGIITSSPRGSLALPGSSPLGEPAADASAIVLQEYELGGKGNPTASAATNGPGPQSSQPGELRAAAYVGAGEVHGFVLDSTLGTPISSVSVSSAPAVGVCSGGCASTLSDSNGFFNLSAPSGGAVLVFDNALYLENKTWVTVPNGSIVSVGRIFLVHDGYAYGVVRSFGPSHLPIPGVTVSALSLDGLIAGGLAGTASNGSFRVAVPPVPSQITFSPPTSRYPYLPNVTFANVTPYGAADVGTVYLEGGFNISADLIDRGTGLPIASSLPTELWSCSPRQPGLCVPGVLVSGSIVSSPALAGPMRVKAMAFGYVVNFTSVPDVPSSDPGTVISLGKIYLTPMGVFQISTNLSGGPPPNQTWAGGTVFVSVCTLDGMEVATFPWFPTPMPEIVSNPCWSGGSPNDTQTNPGNSYPLGGTGRLVGPPLRDMMFVEAEVGFPVSTTSLPGSAPGQTIPPFSSNFTWLNLTPGRVTNAGSVDISPGGLVTGRIHVGITGTYPGSTVIKACSTDEQWVCAAGSATTGCLTGTDAFCLAAPGGPVKLSVFVPGVGENHTWVEVPVGCCRQEGTAVDVGVINITGGLTRGAVNGTVWVSDAPPGQHLPPGGLYATVTACYVGPPLVGSTTGGLICNSTASDTLTGNFSLLTVTGWNKIEAIGPGYLSNWTWVDVMGANSSGTIVLSHPEGALAGQVLTSQGTGIYEAQVIACPVGAPSNCLNVGSGGLTSSYGQYYGALPGAPFPSGAYQITASAAGYASNWTWANVTAGQLTMAPTIRLGAVGVNGSAFRATGSAAPSVGGWIDGRVVDSATHLGIYSVSPLACRVGGGGCQAVFGLTSLGGEFNGSLSAGAYQLFLNQTDYLPLTIFLNLTTASYLHLGSLSLTPYAHILGRVGIYPWFSLTEGQGLGPNYAAVQVCDSAGHQCGSRSTVATDGTFNVSAPPGLFDELTVVGGGINLQVSPGNGFNTLFTTVNVSGNFLRLPLNGPNIGPMGIFGSLVGDVRDGSTWNGSASTASRPVPFAAVTAQTNGIQYGTVDFVTGGGGEYTAFFPSDGTRTGVRAVAPAFWAANETISGAVAPASSAVIANLTLPHYGWAALNVTDFATKRPVPYLYLKVTVADLTNGTTVTTQEITNGNGFINITAPAGTSDILQTESQAHVNQTRVIGVVESRTAYPGDISLRPLGGGNGTWVRSTYVNTVGVPPVRTVVDGRTGAAIYKAGVVVTTGGGVTSYGQVETNGLGQFLVLANPDPADQLLIRAPSYGTYAATYSVARGGSLTLNRIPMVGDGIIAGRVTIVPTGAPAANVEVMACPLNVSVCSNIALTNGSGGFWVDAPAGNDSVTLITNDYLANQTALVYVLTDSFVWLGGIPVYAFAHLNGTVLGLPTGVPLNGANVSICSPIGTPSGPCFETVFADGAGRFALSAPPSSYVLKVEAADYNTSYLPIAITAGQRVDLGTIFLFAYGVARGTVVADSNGAPISNASVVACSRWLPSGCLPPTVTGANGTFQLALPPGSTLLDASASGYNDNFTTVTIASGAVTDMAPIRLRSYIPPIPATVSGSVSDFTHGAPIRGAIVAAFEGAVRLTSTSTNGDGAYSLSVYWGSIRVSASAPGYRTVSRDLLVSSNLTGVDFVLSTMTYNLSGTVTDRSTDAPVPGVAIENGTTVLATTGADGRFAAQLPNGTYQLLAVPPAATAYPTLGFGVNINGAGTVHDLSLPLGGVLTSFTVVGASTGLPVVGAIVTLNGTVGGVLVQRTGPTNPSGNVSFHLPAGNYAVEVFASGFPNYVGHVSVSGSTASFVIEMGAVTGTTPFLLPGGNLAWLVVAAIVIAVVAGALLFNSRRQPDPSPPSPPEPEARSRWVIEEPDDEIQWQDVEP